MCGIGGFYGAGDTETLERMTDALSRRGPDGKGVWREGEVGLAHTRLSIIDLSPGGSQPMKSASGKSIIVFNGEIYNYRELKREHAGRYPFKTESDTEVILALYEAYGVEAFKKLNGMFAFALYDTKTRELYLVRDRMGKKPLYWGIFGGAFVFGSELKALRCHSGFSPAIDPHALRLYLASEYVPTPFSIFSGIRKVRPGSYLRYTKGKAEEIAYWDRPRGGSTVSFDDALKTLDEKLGKSVERRLVSDVPLGIFLSGGIDSSTVAYYARRSSEHVRTFSIAFDDDTYNESHYAEEVARVLGTEHSVERFSARACLDLIPDILSYVDEPLADASILPTYLLSGSARKQVKVALGGDGADELFAGYPTFQAESFVAAYEALPRMLKEHVLAPLVRALPVSHSYMSIDFRLKKFLEGVGSDPRHRHQVWLGAFSPSEAENVLAEKNTDSASLYGHWDEHFSDIYARERFLNDLLWAYARTYLMDQVLVKVDRASMAQGLEVRAPFLDHELVEFVSTLPYAYKYRSHRGKYLLRKLMEGKLPQSVLQRKKQGFGIPLGAWLRGELKELSHDLLSEQSLKKSGVFQAPAVRRLLDEHTSGKRDHRKKLWTLMVFQLWHRAWAGR